MNQLRVVLVDDRMAIRRFVRAEIEGGTPFQVVGEACNGDEALQIVKDQQPDVVVMDVRMPIVDGIEDARRIKALFPDIHIFAFTESEDEIDRRDLEAAGVTATLRKDRSLDFLVQMLWSCMRKTPVRQETEAPAP